MKRSFLLVLIIFSALSVCADNIPPKDTTKVVDIEQVIIIGSPKETTKLRQLPASVSLLSQHDLQAYQISSLKNISNVVPNLFIPDYGSKLTSAVYIRGIGARMNTPSVGLYVDNVPYIDKSAFDFNFYDIERIDVLRGPQSTLYGRNAMGGLINIHTRSPFSYQGTDLKLSAGTYKSYSASLTHYHRVSNKFAFSAGGFYENNGGFYDNVYKNKKADPLSSGGGRIRSIWLPTENLKFDLNVNYEYTDQGGYAYGKYNATTGKIAPVSYNDESKYRRGLFNTNLNIEYQARNFIVNAVTGYQNLNDRMFMDQDFSTSNMFNVTQKQKENTISEEITFKSSKPTKNYQWVTGAFGFYQTLNTNSPVLFKEDGMAMIQAMMDAAMAASPVKVKLTDNNMQVDGNYDTPTLGAALYHQSTYNNLFIKGLSLTAGLRLDYEKIKVKHNTSTQMNAKMMMGNVILSDYSLPVSISGKESDDFVQLLPKFALKYNLNKNDNIYATVSKGYRSGGYNIQMFSDLIEAKMQSNPNATTGDDNIKKTITYKPEFSWNYEAGSHLSLWDGKIWADVAAFLMDTRDQQITQFSPSGLGRMMVNAGHSQSKGFEIGLRSSITKDFSINLNYGYTEAKFKNYVDSVKNTEGNYEAVNYKGNYVPMIPRQTLSLGAEYGFSFGSKALVNRLILQAQYSGAGKIYWTEENTVSQSFYGTLNTRASIVMKDVQVDFWAKNLLDKDYATFYFESMGSSYMQKGRPMQLGVDLRYKF